MNKDGVDPRELRRWRVIAQAAAVQKGAKTACGLCKRATTSIAQVVLMGKMRPLRRQLCSTCRVDVMALLDRWERERDNYDLPIDRGG